MVGTGVSMFIYRRLNVTTQQKGESMNLQLGPMFNLPKMQDLVSHKSAMVPEIVRGDPGRPLCSHTVNPGGGT